MNKMSDLLQGNKDQELEEVAKNWASMVVSKLRNNADNMPHGKDGFIMRGTKKELRLSDSIRTKRGKLNGVISNISFTFEQHGVFVHKGVGRGYAISGGMVVRKAPEPTKNPRQPNDWFNSVIEENLPELADKLVEIQADAVFNATRMTIR